MLKQGDVDQIKTVGNKKIVRVSINPQAIENNAAFYKTVFGADYDAAIKTSCTTSLFRHHKR